MKDMPLSLKFIEKYIAPVQGLACKVPRVVSVEVTTRCQLDCIYCNRDRNNPQDLPLQKLHILHQRLKGVQKVIICGIGESFCYPDLYHGIWALKNHRISIVTNGAIPINFAKLNRERNVDLLVFSIDGTTEEKMQSICRGYNFQVLKENLLELRKYPRIAGIINTTLTEQNIEEIQPLIKFAAEYGLLAVNFELPIGDEEFVSIHKERINQRIKQAVQLAQQKNVIFNQFYRLTCNTGGWIIPNVRINGDFYPCCNGMHKGTRLGNLYEDELAVLWKEQAEPLLCGEDYCLKCHLVKNLVRVVAK